MVGDRTRRRGAVDRRVARGVAARDAPEQRRRACRRRAGRSNWRGRARASGVVRSAGIGRACSKRLVTETHQGHFFAYLYRLRLIQRWVLMRSAIPESVGEHSFQVALLTHGLCTIARDVFSKDVDTGSAVVLALFHDAEEVVTGDIPA